MNPSEINRSGYDTTDKIATEDKAANFLRYLWPGQRILDLGCGSGSDLKYFVSKKFEVTGVDSSLEMIELARKAAPSAELIVSGIEEVELKENSFNAVWASASLLDVPKSQMPAVLNKIHRCLVTGGVFYVSMKKGEELTGLLKEHDFEVIQSTTHEISNDTQTHPWIAIIARAQKV